MRVDDASLLNDPHSHVLRIATEVEAEWEGRARRSWIGGSSDAIPAPSASGFDAIRAAVLALRQHQRELLLLHVEGLELSADRSPPRAAAASRAARAGEAYCHLRWRLPDAR